MERLTERAEVNNCPGIWVKEGFANEGLRTWFNGYDEGYSAINKCVEYEDLEEQGLLLKLPCKVGDTVYSLDRFCGGYSLDCPSRPCKECSDYQLEIYEGKFQLKDIYDFGKTVFLTEAEAEEALKRMEREE